MKRGKEKSVIQQRLLDVCSALGCSAREFSKNIGMSETYIANLNKDITSNVLLNICNTYPDVNIMWIITGYGDILKNDSDNCEIDISYELKRIKLNYEELKKDYRQVLEELGRYKERCEQLMRKV